LQHLHSPQPLCILIFCHYQNQKKYKVTLKKHFVDSIEGTNLEHLANGLKDNNYDTNKTLDFLKQIDAARSLNVLEYVPSLGRHYDIK
jgi:hypothetical protein